jgi:hypothetical protein
MINGPFAAPLLLSDTRMFVVYTEACLVAASVDFERFCATGLHVQ